MITNSEGINGKLGIESYMKEIFIIGSGGFSKQVIELVEEINQNTSKYDLIGLIDDNQNLIGKEILGYKVLGNMDYLMKYSKKQKVYGVVAIANGEARLGIVNKLSYVNWVNLVHPNAIVSKYLNIGTGNVICAGTVINPECKIGNHCHINIGCTFGHDVEMHDFVTVMPGCNISGNVLLKKNSFLGTGAKVLQGLVIEENSVLGAGAVLTRNTEVDKVYIGVPAVVKMESVVL